ncbi:Nudix hydrolase 17, mitochondrial [Astathelohania contejeani]|uniref:Nudix hydrolase 17, mitochondrial n=1 Tax=Astathelohania contejeani TaxID=164912 RepID=A0ABQ7HXQ6_9MICR|nr:Nudix hydrolase 17, mitochondrial [Thelohania contejeani]
MSGNVEKAGTLPITSDNKLVLVTSIKKKDYVLPKGGIKLRKGESAKSAAERETVEEAGVIGETETDSFYTDSLGIKWFILRVSDILDNWEEKNLRTRIIIDIKDLIEHPTRFDIKIRENVIEAVNAAIKMNKIKINENK